MRSPSSAVCRQHIAGVLAVAAIIAAPIRAQAQVRRATQGAWGARPRVWTTTQT
jgi:hypothetical protein